MKNMLLIVFALLAVSFIAGCEDDNTDTIFIEEDLVPAAPQGVFSITGDEAVYIYWNGPYETDIAGYYIWRSYNPTTDYVRYDYVDASSNPNLDLLIYEYVDDAVVNGETYYYAISTEDFAGQESDLSAEDVFDTPRPEGIAMMYDYAVQPNSSGFILDTIPVVVAYDNPLADVYVSSDINGVLYLEATNSLVDLQDMGYTYSFDDITYAPDGGWSDNGWVELILGHTYVVWDDDSFYAKLRVEQLTSTTVTFSWGFQVDQNNPELVAGMKLDAEKPVHTETYLKRNVTSNR